MLNLDLTLRTPGRVLMLERNAAQALVDHAFEERSTPRGNSLLQRAFGAVARFSGVRAQADDEGEEIDRGKLAAPSISWAGTIEYGDGYAIVDNIAVIDVSGVLTPDGYFDWWSGCWYGGYSQIEAAIVAARADDRVKAIFMRFDSPGGLADGCFDLADMIREGNAAADGKPVWASVRLACSAAYALASAADRIYAAAESYVGSIGVVITHYDASGWLTQNGIKVEAIQSGSRKTDGVEWKPLSDDARTHFQGIVDQCARRFVALVSAGRNIAAEAVVALQAQFFLAQHDDPAQSGEALKLVDAIGSERTAFTALVSSLTKSAGGAPGESGRQARAENQTTETDMSMKEQIAALREKAAKGDQAALAELKDMGVALKADTMDADDDEDDEDDPPDKGKKDGEDDEDDDDSEPDAKAKGSKAGFALLRHKSAKGREALANRLAGKVSSGKLTYGEATRMLADAPKASRLAESMSGRDHNPGNDNGSSSEPGAELGGAVDRMLAKKGLKANG